MLTQQYHYSEDKSTVVNVCANLGALAGGIVIGHLSRLSEEERPFCVTMAIFIGAVLAYLMLTILLGPENRGAELGVDRNDVYSPYDSDRESELKKRARRLKHWTNHSLNIKKMFSV
ncbi:hypothetical protein Cantr_07327 [Candida viswanathii]|uniref:Uncharacterized protein n=1 Tax=Candida viswanathii TaxID=5486 RepID=A0A367Y1F9_9ASCO|nr:hypothetical protein Cantr_07327 [Candida viswanathii]